MPLRDHFRPPLDNVASWEGFHSGWPMVIVQQLRKLLPPGYVAAPRVHLGSQVEIDVATYESDTAPSGWLAQEGDGGLATAVWAPAAPSVAVEAPLPDYDEYEVRVLDAKRGHRLVAAIELVSPRNKDRPESRNAFVGKCAALLQQGVAVSIVDLVTIRHFNLYAELMTFLGQADPTLGDPPPPVYAASCRWTVKDKRPWLEAWSNRLVVGQPLPTLPLWLSPTRVVPLDLERGYEETCHDLWLT